MNRFNRRQFIKTSIGIAGLTSMSFVATSRSDEAGKKNPVRLGGPVLSANLDPAEWVRVHQNLKYSAAYCPVEPDASPEMIKAFEKAAEKADLVIAEAGAWSNPISPDDNQRKEAFDLCCAQLNLADEIGAKCCVNIAGSRDPERWDGPHPNNLSSDTFDMIVEVTRKIIDSVKPKRTFWALETMPWIFPDSVEAYLKLLKAIERKAFAVHIDPVNLVNSPRRYFKNGDMIREAFNKLGSYIKSCHAKDIRMEDGFPVNIQECKPGLGRLDYAVYFKEISKLPDPPPLMMEHLEDPEEYQAASNYLRSIARENDIHVL